MKIKKASNMALFLSSIFFTLCLTVFFNLCALTIARFLAAIFKAALAATESTIPYTEYGPI